MSKYQHQPVMLSEVMQCLQVKPNGCYIDATFGRGGHSNAILKSLGPTGKLIVLDKDHDAIAHAQTTFAQDPRIQIVHSCFSKMGQVIPDLMGKVDGILVDLGVSSAQLDDPSRGFSFRHDAQLDMRMDKAQKMTAAQWLEKAEKKEISEVLKKYGEEIDAFRIAEKILETRAISPVRTTHQLSDLVSQIKSKVRPAKKIHPATLTFQAIRIHVNQELDVLEKFLKIAPALLNKDGILAVLSFHSLEDRMVKRCFRNLILPQIPRKLPILDKAIKKAYAWQLKRLKPSDNECQINPRARSAVLRAIRKQG